MHRITYVLALVYGAVLVARVAGQLPDSPPAAANEWTYDMLDKYIHWDALHKPAAASEKCEPISPADVQSVDRNTTELIALVDRSITCIYRQSVANNARCARINEALLRLHKPLEMGWWLIPDLSLLWEDLSALHGDRPMPEDEREFMDMLAKAGKAQQKFELRRALARGFFRTMDELGLPSRDVDTQTANAEGGKDDDSAFNYYEGIPVTQDEDTARLEMERYGRYPAWPDPRTPVQIAEDEYPIGSDARQPDDDSLDRARK